MSEKEARQWYVIRAVGGKEKKVKEYIETMVHNSHLEEYISQVLIPKRFTPSATERKSARRRCRIRATYLSKQRW